MFKAISCKSTVADKITFSNRALTDADVLLPVALRVHVGRAFPPGLVCVQAEGRAHHWGYPLMKA